MKQEKHSPIGIFDSGIGGLSICHAVKKMLPEENVVYFADIAFAPYGNKSTAMIVERAHYIVKRLVDHGCKLIVVACNTATVNTIEQLRATFTIPIVGVEPGVKPAALESKNGVIGVLATEQTLKSASFQRLKTIYANSVRVETIACPDFVALVENQKHDSELAVQIAEHYIRPLLLAGCDQLILGCTHFPFLISAIEKVVQQQASIIDTTVPVVMEIKKQLHNLSLSKATGALACLGHINFWTSAEPQKTAQSIAYLWKQKVNVVHVKPEENQYYSSTIKVKEIN